MRPFSASILLTSSLLAVLGVMYTRLYAKISISVDFPEWFDTPIEGNNQSGPIGFRFTNTTIATEEAGPFEARPLNRSDSKTHPNTTKTDAGPQSNSTFEPSGEPFDFAACLLMKDDNMILPEWLAYHYQVLPLRHLIIGLDPFALTSPNIIVEEYRKEGMNITIWHEDDYIFDGPRHYNRRVFANDTAEAKVQGYLWRQRAFLTNCLQDLKQRKNLRWTLLVDTDEYLAFNHFDQESEEYSPRKVRKCTLLQIFFDDVGLKLMLTTV